MVPLALGISKRVKVLSKQPCMITSGSLTTLWTFVKTICTY